jgi:hypothetical protein
MAQPGRQTIGMTRLAGLFVFMVTAALFSAAAVNLVIAGLDDLLDVAAAFAYAVAAVAAFAMLIDTYDLWVRGRSFSTKVARGLRSVVMIAALGAVASILLTSNISLIVYLGPALILYYAVARAQQRPGTSGTSPAASPRSSGGARTRQRRGGRKRR